MLVKFRSVDRDDRSLGVLLTALTATAGLIVLLTFRTAILVMPMRQLCVLVACIAGAALTAVPLLAMRRLWSAAFMYLLMLVIFHLGIPIALAVGATVPYRSANYIATWWGSGHVPEALYLSALAVVALTTAFSWVQLRRRPVAANAASSVAPVKFAQMGAAATIGGVALYLGYIVVAAPQLLAGGNYDDYLDTVGGTGLIALASMLIGFGICIAAVSGKSRARTLSWVIFGIFAAVTMSFGSRTAAMFPAVAAVIAAAASANRTPKARTAVVVVVMGLLSITAVQQIRTTGLTTKGLDTVSLNPVASLAETGSTVRTVAEVVSWQRTYHEPPRDGLTYATPLLRQWEKLMAQQPDGGTDTRFASIQLHERTPDYQLGFSPVAEAFLNFGTVGVLTVFAGLGLLFGLFDSRRLSYEGAARLGVIMFALAYNVRQGSNSLPVTVIGGLVLVWAASRLKDKPMRSPGLDGVQDHAVRGAVDGDRRTTGV